MKRARILFSSLAQRGRFRRHFVERGLYRDGRHTDEEQQASSQVRLDVRGTQRVGNDRDRITPARAIQRTAAHLSREEQSFLASIS